MTTRRALRWVGMLAVALLTHPGAAATLRVPEDFASVLAAVDAAVSGDSVLVGPGTWTDRATRIVAGNTVTACAFPRGGVTMIGVAGADATVIDAQVSGAGFVITMSYSGYPGQQLTLEGLTITGGGKGGAGIFAGSSGLLVVRSCKVSGMGNLGGGSAILVQRYTANQDLLMEDSEVSFNGGSTWPGVYSQVGSLSLHRSRFEGNQGRAVYFSPSGNQGDVTIQDCEFVANRSVQPAVLISDPFTLLVERNVFLRNTCTSGSGAALMLSDCFGPIRSNVFAFDSTLAGYGAGIHLSDYGGTISENTFYGCYADPTRGGSAIRMGSGASVVTFSNNIVAQCSGSGIVWIQPGETPTFSCNGIWSNPGGLGDYVPSPSDQFIDPVFCDVASLDFTLSEASPYTAGNSPCGQVGAYDEGCGAVSVESSSWGKIKSLYR